MHTEQFPITIIIIGKQGFHFIYSLKNFYIFLISSHSKKKKKIAESNFYVFIKMPEISWSLSVFNSKLKSR